MKCGGRDLIWGNSFFFYSLATNRTTHMLLTSDNEVFVQ